MGEHKSEDSPNPFSDDQPADKPLDAELVDPAASAVNPYASPREASQRVAEPVGIWRDGTFVVAHRESIFPPICIRTNEPSQRGFRCRLLWSYPIDIVRRTVTFDVGLCEKCIRRYRRLRITGWIMVVSSIALLALAIGGVQVASVAWSALGIVGVLGVGLWLAGRPGVVLAVKRVRGPYFWLRGAHRGYLDRLPNWPESAG